MYVCTYAYCMEQNYLHLQENLLLVGLACRDS